MTSSPRRSASRRRSPAEVRQLLLDASVRVFGAKGYSGATSDEITEAAGVSASVAFRHFRTKGELFREAVIRPFADALSTFTAHWQRSFQHPVDEHQMMHDFISAMYDNLAAHEQALKGLATTEGSIDPDLSADITKHLTDIFEQFHKMGMEEAARRQWFPGEDMELTSRLILSMIAGVVAYNQWFMPTGRKRYSRRRLVDHMAHLMLFGLRLAPPGEAGDGTRLASGTTAPRSGAR